MAALYIIPFMSRLPSVIRNARACKRFVPIWASRRPQTEKRKRVRHKGGYITISRWVGGEGGQMNYTGTKEFNFTVAGASTNRWILSSFKLGRHFHQAKSISDLRHARPPRVTEYFLWTLWSEESSHNSGKRSSLTTSGRLLGLLGTAGLTNKQYR